MDAGFPFPRSPTVSKPVLPHHIPVYPPALIIPQLPESLSSVIDADTYRDISYTAESVRNLTRLFVNIVNLAVVIVCVLLFGYSLYSVSLLALFLVAIICATSTYCLNPILLPVIIILEGQYVRRLSAAMDRLASQHNLGAAGVTLRVRSVRGPYRQPWAIYAKQFDSEFKAAVVIECPDARPIHYSLTLTRPALRPHFIWEDAYPTSLRDVVSQSDWVSAITSLQRGSVDINSLDALFIGIPVATVIVLGGILVLAMTLLPATDLGNILVVLLIFTFCLVSLAVVTVSSVAHRARIQHGRAKLTSSVQRICSMLNMAGTGAHWSFEWKADAVGFVHSFVATPMVSITEDLEGGDDFVAPDAAPGLLDAYPVVDRRDSEEPSAPFLSQRVRADDYGEGDEFV
ncbi:hypothetical protein J8273_0733 [Carpediemonas membranifera]|uniref:Uncharacterized protein n=1 Tax=Carpediemonas membranifera TaxID=201153 RepID=A0A8J6AZ63_9EUKA|nr:hypothetical protein J8273_0733 [Carpediemonas membranifera]|eukprot:KAG9397603.1 hypothetical protein J8273_0733 [Carpediemonas membranifera]